MLLNITLHKIMAFEWGFSFNRTKNTNIKYFRGSSCKQERHRE